VSVISTATNTVTAVINDSSFNMPDGIAVTPDGRKVYVVNNGPNFDGNTVSVIDTGTNTVTETITLPDGKGPNTVSVTPDGLLGQGEGDPPHGLLRRSIDFCLPWRAATPFLHGFSLFECL
jgi:YVTN family beta-propeller protein